ncbi:MAG: cation diffusion facilitator family transporter [Ginsengibacter sp.]
MAVKENLRLQKLITVVAIVLFFVKLFAWYLTGSLAILTDALESIVNIVAALIGIYSLSLSARPKDETHPYGHGKIEFVSAAIEGTLITVAGLFIIYEGIKNLFHPAEVSKIDFGIVLIGASGLINYIAGEVCIKTGKKNNSVQLVAAGRHLKSDTYTTIGIFVGLVLLYFTNWLWIDSAVAILFAVLIIYTGYKIIRTSIAGIMDEADQQLLENLVNVLDKNRRENWIDIHNLRIIKYGSTLHCDCHLTVPWYLNVNEAHAEIEALANLVRHEFGTAIEFFVHSDGCKEFSCPICSKQNCLVRQHPFQKKIDWTIENISKDNRHKISTQ